MILGVSASIAAYKACDLIRELRKKNITVIPVLSKDAHHFVTPLTIQTLAGSTVRQEFFGVQDHSGPVHLDILKEAKLILLAPATADLIARVSMGLADDLLSCMVLAAECPVIVAPAMNGNMYKNAVTQEHVARLKARKFTFVGPVEGDLACGECARGHIASTEEIVKTAGKSLGLW